MQIPINYLGFCVRILFPFSLRRMQLNLVFPFTSSLLRMTCWGCAMKGKVSYLGVFFGFYVWGVQVANKKML